MSTRVGKGLIGVRSPRGIEWYRSRSVRIPVAPRSRHFESTCPGNSSTKVWRTFQPSVGQRRDRVQPGQGALESARRGESNGIGLEASACL